MVRLKGGVLGLGVLIPFLFQFHMVRLKDGLAGFNDKNSNISIPYGTIKRYLAIRFNVPFMHFNSIWYD